MTDVGDNASQTPRRPPPGPPTAAKTPTQEIPRPGVAGLPPAQDTGQTMPIARRDLLGAPPEAPRGAPSDGERAKAEKAARARQKAAEKAARKAAARRPRQTRRAKLRVSRVDPWSVTKTAFLLSIALGVMCVVAVFLIFSIMDAAGLWDKVNSTIQSVVNQDRGSRFDIKDYVAMSRVMGITMLIAVIDVVLITALATLGAFIYNMSAAMLGGIEVTLAEDLDY
jgi:hypothetical protein